MSVPVVHSGSRLLRRNCVGAIDGTHIPISVRGGVDPAAWRNRKGFLSQNVFAACSFDLLFQFIHAGWEGSAHDAWVLRDAVLKNLFVPPPGRYYLADAGFYNADFMLVPYSKVRYHLKEWEQPGVQKPQNKEELFNLRHAGLRSAIERIFGVLKRKFNILNKQAEFSISQQVLFVTALTGLYNFIAVRDRDIDDDFHAPRAESFTQSSSSRIIDNDIEQPSIASSNQMKQLRDRIAQEMWDDYQQYLKDRPLFEEIDNAI
jgi:hypothetical protein